MGESTAAEEVLRRRCEHLLHLHHHVTDTDAIAVADTTIVAAVLSAVLAAVAPLTKTQGIFYPANRHHVRFPRHLDVHSLHDSVFLRAPALRFMRYSRLIF